MELKTQKNTNESTGLDQNILNDIEYEHKCLFAIISDYDFLERIKDMVTDSYWTTDANKWIYSEIKQYIETYKLCPTILVLRQIINKSNNPNKLLKISVNDLLDILENKLICMPTDLDWVKIQCKVKYIIRALPMQF